MNTSFELFNDLYMTQVPDENLKDFDPFVLCPRPHDAVEAMLEGLRKLRSHKNFQLRMSTYGEVSRFGDYYREDYLSDHPDMKGEINIDDDNKQICFGCAATCTVINLAAAKGIDIPLGEIERRYRFDNLFHFEKIINELRLGMVMDFVQDYHEYSPTLQTLTYERGRRLERRLEAKSLVVLPLLNDTFNMKMLKPYENLASALRSNGF